VWRAAPPAPPIDRTLVRAFGSAALAAALMLLAPILVRAMASTIGPGAIASFNYAQKLMELPVAILITSISTVALSRLSVLHANKMAAAAATAVSRDTQYALLLAVAVTLLGVWFSDSVVHVLFSRGKMDAVALGQVSALTRVALLSVPLIAISSMAVADLNASKKTHLVLKIYIFLCADAAFAGVAGTGKFVSARSDGCCRRLPSGCCHCAGTGIHPAPAGRERFVCLLALSHRRCNNCSSGGGGRPCVASIFALAAFAIPTVWSGRCGAIAGAALFALPFNLTTTPYRSMKRLLDLLISVMALLALAPAMLLVALAIYRFDRGPIFSSNNGLAWEGVRLACTSFAAWSSMPSGAGGFQRSTKILALRRWGVSSVERVLTSCRKLSMCC